MAGKPVWAALNIHHADGKGRPVFIPAGEQLPDWVDAELVADWVKGGAATRTKPKDGD